MPLDSKGAGTGQPAAAESPAIDDDRLARFRGDIYDQGLAYSVRRRPGNGEESFACVVAGTAREAVRQLMDLPAAIAEEELDLLQKFLASQLARRRSRRGPQSESSLLLQINRPIPTDKRDRLLTLIEQRDDAGLDDSEQSELVALADEIQGYEQARLEALTELAAVRGVSLDELTRQLQISSTRPK
jgi:hypothetical protein